MTAANILFVVVGALLLLAGVSAAAIGILTRKSDPKRGEALFIAGTMAAALGLILGGFAIVYTTTKPYDFNDSGNGR